MLVKPANEEVLYLHFCASEAQAREMLAGYRILYLEPLQPTEKKDKWRAVVVKES